MLQLAISAVPLIYGVLVIYGALSDLGTFRIPNWVSYGLIALFAVYTLLVWLNTPYMPSLEFRWPPYTFNILMALFVFAVCVVFWKLGFVGGGDVKYLTATALWMGVNNGTIFILLLTGLAVVLALVLKLLRLWPLFVKASWLPAFVLRLLDKIGRNELPYGFPIGIAAIVLLPSIFNL